MMMAVKMIIFLGLGLGPNPGTYGTTFLWSNILKVSENLENYYLYINK